MIVLRCYWHFRSHPLEFSYMTRGIQDRVKRGTPALAVSLSSMRPDIEEAAKIKSDAALLNVFYFRNMAIFL